MSVRLGGLRRGGALSASVDLNLGPVRAPVARVDADELSDEIESGRVENAVRDRVAAELSLNQVDLNSTPNTPGAAVGNSARHFGSSIERSSTEKDNPGPLHTAVPVPGGDLPVPLVPRDLSRPDGDGRLRGTGLLPPPVPLTATSVYQQQQQQQQPQRPGGISHLGQVSSSEAPSSIAPSSQELMPLPDHPADASAPSDFTHTNGPRRNLLRPNPHASYTSSASPNFAGAGLRAFPATGTASVGLPIPLHGADNSAATPVTTSAGGGTSSETTAPFWALPHSMPLDLSKDDDCKYVARGAAQIYQTVQTLTTEQWLAADESATAIKAALLLMHVNIFFCLIQEHKHLPLQTANRQQGTGTPGSRGGADGSSGGARRFSRGTSDQSGGDIMTPHDLTGTGPFNAVTNFCSYWLRASPFTTTKLAAAYKNAASDGLHAKIGGIAGLAGCRITGVTPEGGCVARIGNFLLDPHRRSTVSLLYLAYMLFAVAVGVCLKTWAAGRIVNVDNPAWELVASVATHLIVGLFLCPVGIVVLHYHASAVEVARGVNSSVEGFVQTVCRAGAGKELSEVLPPKVLRLVPVNNTLDEAEAFPVDGQSAFGSAFVGGLPRPQLDTASARTGPHINGGHPAAAGSPHAHNAYSNLSRFSGRGSNHSSVKHLPHIRKLGSTGGSVRSHHMAPSPTVADQVFATQERPSAMLDLHVLDIRVPFDAFSQLCGIVIVERRDNSSQLKILHMNDRMKTIIGIPAGTRLLEELSPGPALIRAVHDLLAKAPINTIGKPLQTQILSTPFRVLPIVASYRKTGSALNSSGTNATSDQQVSKVCVLIGYDRPDPAAADCFEYLTSYHYGLLKLLVKPLYIDCTNSNETRNVLPPPVMHRYLPLMKYASSSGTSCQKLSRVAADVPSWPRVDLKDAFGSVVVSVKPPLRQEIFVSASFVPVVSYMLERLRRHPDYARNRRVEITFSRVEDVGTTLKLQALRVSFTPPALVQLVNFYDDQQFNKMMSDAGLCLDSGRPLGVAGAAGADTPLPSMASVSAAYLNNTNNGADGDVNGLTKLKEEVTLVAPFSSRRLQSWSEIDDARLVDGPADGKDPTTLRIAYWGFGTDRARPLLFGKLADRCRQYLPIATAYQDHTKPDQSTLERLKTPGNVNLIVMDVTSDHRGPRELLADIEQFFKSASAKTITVAVLTEDSRYADELLVPVPTFAALRAALERPKEGEAAPVTLGGGLQPFGGPQAADIVPEPTLVNMPGQEDPARLYHLFFLYVPLTEEPVFRLLDNVRCLAEERRQQDRPLTALHDTHPHLVTMLGSGGRAEVRLVQDRTSGDLYARKEYRFFDQSEKSQQEEACAKEEYEALNKLRGVLQNRYIVRLLHCERSQPDQHQQQQQQKFLWLYLEYCPLKLIDVLRAARPSERTGQPVILPCASTRTAAYPPEALDYRNEIVPATTEPSDEACLFRMKAIARALLHVASALEGVHSIQYAHLDLNPNNVLIRRKTYAETDGFGWEGCLADFSESKPLQRMVADGTGTALYVAPEMHGQDELSEKADIYSFGVVALHFADWMPTDALIYDVTAVASGLTAGERQHRSSLLEMLELHRKHFDATFGSLPKSGLRHQLRTWLNDVIVVCLDPCPRNRPSAAALLTYPLFTWYQKDPAAPRPGMDPGRAPLPVAPTAPVESLRGSAMLSRFPPRPAPATGDHSPPHEGGRQRAYTNTSATTANTAHTGDGGDHNPHAARRTSETESARRAETQHTATHNASSTTSTAQIPTVPPPPSGTTDRDDLAHPSGVAQRRSYSPAEADDLGDAHTDENRVVDDDDDIDEDIDWTD